MRGVLYAGIVVCVAYVWYIACRKILGRARNKRVLKTGVRRTPVFGYPFNSFLVNY
jgi:hypothetical protein